MGARDGREIGVAQFQLEGARKISALAQPPSNHFTEPHQRGLQSLGVTRVLVERMLVANRFGIDAFSYFVIKPSTRILTPRFSCEGEPPFSEAMFQITVFQAREVAHFPDADRVKHLLHHLPDARAIA